MKTWILPLRNSINKCLLITNWWCNGEQGIELTSGRLMCTRIFQLSQEACDYLSCIWISSGSHSASRLLGITLRLCKLNTFSALSLPISVPVLIVLCDSFIYTNQVKLCPFLLKKKCVTYTRFEHDKMCMYSYVHTSPSTPKAFCSSKQRAAL